MLWGNGMPRWRVIVAGLLLALAAGPGGVHAEKKQRRAPAVKKTPPMPVSPWVQAHKGPVPPRLVVLLVVDQFRADYVEKFYTQWTSGLKQMVEEGAWFRNAAYPYATTETCVGHSTISTGALPATHGMVANEWWDRRQGAQVTCTADPNAKDIGYAGGKVQGGNSAWRMEVPSFAEELRFQRGDRSRVVTFSLKARAAIALAGHKADAVTWFDAATGAWATSSRYGAVSFIEDYVKAHPVREDFGKTWVPLLPPSAYLYDGKTPGASAPEGWNASLPHALKGKNGATAQDRAFYRQWQTSPYADVYLARLAERAVDALGLGQRGGTDFLGVSFSTLDYAGHSFGPRSHEVQDVLARLDRTLGALFEHLDRRIGHANYVVVVTGDHGVAPIPEDLQKAGSEAGWLKLADVQQGIEKALEPFNYPKPAVAAVTGSDIYFAPEVWERLRGDAPAMRAVVEAIEKIPGVASVHSAGEIKDQPATANPLLAALAANYFEGRSGDLFVVSKPYWPMDFSAAGSPRSYGTAHGTPYSYDQRVPILMMGAGIHSGVYWTPATPADIAPTLAALCGITLASRDGHVLEDALAPSSVTHRPASR